MTEKLVDEAIRSPTVNMEGPQPDLRAAHELPHNDLDRGEALGLITAVFGPAVEDSAGIFNEMPEARFINDHSAVMPAGSLAEGALGVDNPQSTGSAQESPSLVESLLPLRTEDEAGNKVPVDLSLERREGELQPANPLVDASIPRELKEGVELAGGEVEVHFPGAAERTPSTIQGASAFYPNVAEDSDLVLAPTARGLETFTQLRTSSAPHSEVQRLTLPDGAQLSETDWGGAEATLNGRTILEVPPPTAVDAAGNSVPMTLAVSGNTIELTVSPSVGTVYPILADPQYIWDAYNWTAWGSSWAGWTPSVTAPGYRSLKTQYPTNISALDLTSGFPGGATPNTGAQWYYSVPRLYSDPYYYGGDNPHSWIEYVGTEAVMFLTEGNNQYFPLMVNGILDIAKSTWVSVGTYNGTQGPFDGWSGSFAYPNYGNTNGKLFSFGLITLENESQAPYRNAVAGQILVQLRDEDTPEFTSLRSPSGWWNNGEAEISYVAKDEGLGVGMLAIGQGNWAGRPVWEYMLGSHCSNLESCAPPIKAYRLPCTGTNANPCQRMYGSESDNFGVAQGPRIKLDATNAPEGINQYAVGVYDPLFLNGSSADAKPHVSLNNATLKVDHSPPTVAFSGSLTEQSKLGTALPSYRLKYTASDGTKEPATIYRTFGAEGSGAAQFRRPADIAVDPSENIWVADRANNRIQKLQPGGGFLAAFSAVGSDQLNSPSAIDSDANGNVWVADTNNQRLVEFNKNGEWIRKVGRSGIFGSGNSEFAWPMGLAVAPNGDVWVADTSNHRVQRFSSTGGFIAAYGSKGAGDGEFREPYAIAVGPNGHVWVADTGNNRIVELDGQGTFLKVVGASGTGVGSLERPVGVQVDNKGNVWATDEGHGRVVQYSERGDVLSQFGARGAGVGQFSFSGASGIATNNVGDIWISNSGSNRIEEWNPPKGTRSGVRSVVFKVDGKELQNPEVNCPQGGCPLSGEWALKSTDYIAGSHTAEVTATDGVGLSKTETFTFSLNPPVPIVNLSGTVTEQGAVGYTRPAYSLRVDAAAQQGTMAVPGSPVFVSRIGSPGTVDGRFRHPSGIAVDSGGNLWVADTENNRIQGFTSSGAFIKAVGSAGSGPGLFSLPKAIAIDPKGNFWVADSGNNRLQQFSPNWEFIRSISSGKSQFKNPEGIAIDANGNIWVSDTGNLWVEKLAENGKLLTVVAGLGAIEPAGIAVGPGGNVWISDSAHDRVVEVSEAGTLLRSFGTAGSGNGQFGRPGALAIDNSGNVWVGDQNNARVQKFSQTGQYLGQFGSPGIKPGQFSFTSTMGIATDAKGNVWVSNSGNSWVERWVQPSRSQITTDIKVDGKSVDTSQVKCTTETCPIARQVRLESPSGTHMLEVKATDGFGVWTSKTRSFKVEADTTKPTLQVGGELANAPEGWVQQETYGFNATATDPSGSGVTSLEFRIDGSPVASVIKACPDGACMASISKAVSTATYSGGAHEAEVIATDGAGNSQTKGWTINVDPQGHITTAEAKATLEAAEETGSTIAIGDAKEGEGEQIEGLVAGLGLETTETGYSASGSAVPMEISEHVGGPMTIEVLPQTELCLAKPEPSQGSAEEEVGDPGEEPATTEGCQSYGGGGQSLTPIQVTPVGVGGSAADPHLVEENATISTNTAASVDTAIRPLDDGGLVFTALRELAAPESYSYRVNLSEDQVLRSIDSKHAQVFYSGHEPAFSISAVTAHDAVGTVVPTTLTVDGKDIITLHVAHRAGNAGSPFVYPILAGSGWEGGFRTIIVSMKNPNGEPEPESPEESDLFEVLDVAPLGSGWTYEGRYTAMSSGPPQFLVGDIPHRGYNFFECRWQLFESQKASGPGTKIPGVIRRPELEQRCHNPQDPEPGDQVIRWAESIAGEFWYDWGKKVEIRRSPYCRAWGERRPKLVNCFADRRVAQGSNKINLIGQYRFGKGAYGLGVSVFFASCQELNGVLPTRPKASDDGYVAYHENYHEYREGGINPYDGPEPGEPCPWGSLNEKVR